MIGKGDRERLVQVTDKARAAVDDHLHGRTDHSPALFISFQPASKNTTSKRLTIAGAQHLCRQLAHRLGIPTFHPHQLRHTLLQETTGDARPTAETLGHRGLASVAGYTKITDQRRREAYEQMQTTRAAKAFALGRLIDRLKEWRPVSGSVFWTSSGCAHWTIPGSIHRRRSPLGRLTGDDLLHRWLNGPDVRRTGATGSTRPEGRCLLARDRPLLCRSWLSRPS